ncbi:hypothetical protein HDU76_003158 [Blyttiomyces sp. JEL0837]|nr:hypothetical protein HDU76_003158 [Blyttiomyces sp. JEL0837]
MNTNDTIAPPATTTKARPLYKTAQADGPIAYIVLGWLTPMLLLGAKKPLEMEDLPQLKPSEQAENLLPMLEGYWKEFDRFSKKETSTRPSITKYVIKKFLGIWLLIFTTYLYISFTSVFLPYIQSAIISKISTGKSNLPAINNGLLLATLYFLISVTRVIITSINRQLVRDLGYRIKSLLISTCFEKSLRVRGSGGGKFGDGRVIQIVNVDGNVVSRLAITLHLVLVSPLQIAAILYSLYHLLGPTIYIAITTILISFITMPTLISLLKQNEKKYKQVGDDRVKLLREIFQGIKYIKLRGSEGFFKEQVGEVRGRQIKALFWIFGFSCGFGVLLAAVPLVLPIATFSVYGQNKNGILDPAVIFPALTFFQALIGPLETFPYTLMSVISSIISWNRLSEFLMQEESKVPFVNQPEDPVAIRVSKASFCWETTGEDESDDKDKKKKEKGKIEKKDEKKDEKEEVKEKVETTETVKELEPFLKDINVEIRKGELTAIVGVVGSGKSTFLSSLLGETTLLKGTISINGSVALCQQQPWLMSQTVRENIYFGNDEDEERLKMVVDVCALETDLKQLEFGLETEIGEKGITLSGGQKARVALDDPLSALDSHVSREIFTKCICEALQSKTRILITHQLYTLPYVDRIIVMDSGRIVEDGRFEELMAKGEGDPGAVLKRMMREYRFGDSGSEKDQSVENTVEAETGIIPVVDKDHGGLITGTRTTKSTPISTVVEVEIEHSSETLPDIIDTKTTQPSTDIKPTEPKQNLIKAEDRERGAVKVKVAIDFYRYGGGLSNFLLVVVSVIVFLLAAVFQNVWVTWWAENKFYWLSFSQYVDIYAALSIAQSFGTFAIIGACMSASYLAARNFHDMAFARLLRAPMSFFDSQAGERTVTKQRKLLNLSQQPTYVQTSIFSWLAFRIDIFMTSVVLLVALYGIYGSSSDNASSIALALGITASMNREIPSLLNLFAFLEARLVSVERLSNYIHDIPEEAPDLLPTDPKKGEWPTKGDISIQGLEVKYASMEEPVLRDIHVVISGGEKVGIVGRTGSGKSTLLTALFRLVEPSKGKVVIDGFDVSKLGLHTLRNRLQIIPQDPVLFSGTIRSNIDPTNNHTDAEIWDALTIVSLKEYVSELPQRLESPITSNGENLSLGQRQLLTLARAICARPTILVMDEASSAVDAAADSLIVSSIRTHFASSTVISIAHRLNTVAGFDKVIVLDMGRVVEFDTPANLLRIDGGVFKGLVDATGSENAELIMKAAEERERENLKALVAKS